MLCAIAIIPHFYFIDQEVVAKLAEVDMIVADLDRANSRVATVERRNVRLTGCSSNIPLISIFRKFCVLKSRPCGVGAILLIGRWLNYFQSSYLYRCLTV